MSEYFFPTRLTEGERYFVQFDIFEVSKPDISSILTLTHGNEENQVAPLDQSLRQGVSPATGSKDVGAEEGEVRIQRILDKITTNEAGEQVTETTTESAKSDGLGNLFSNLIAGNTIFNLRGMRDFVEGISSTFTYEQTAKKILHQIKLPLQNSPSETTSANYTEEGMRNLTTILALIREASRVSKSDHSERIGQSANIGTDRLLGLVQDETLQGVAGAMNRMNSQVLNEMQETFYVGPSKRDYTFNFSLVARNFEDSVAIEQIVRRFHYHASPGTTENSVFWKYPEIIRFSFYDKAGARMNIFSHNNRFVGEDENDTQQAYASKACFITNVNTEFGTMGDQLRFFDEAGNRAGVASVKLTVTLKEAEYFTKQDFDRGL